MSNSILLFRSIVVVILLAGFAHLFAYSTQEKQTITTPKNWDSDTTSIPISEKINSTTNSEQLNKSATYNSSTDYIIGKWKVLYNSDEFKGTIVYKLEKEEGKYNAYTFQYEDENGYTEKAEETKTLIISEFDGYKGEGIYMLTYEGKQYDVSCQIDMVDENTFKLSYDYYGYSDTETWKRF